MSRIAYVGRRYFPYRVADGVYEILAVVGRRRLDEELPVVRIDRDPILGVIPGPLSRRLCDGYYAAAAA
jgi:hypothetical protein